MSKTAYVRYNLDRHMEQKFRYFVLFIYYKAFLFIYLYKHSLQSLFIYFWLHTRNMQYYAIALVSVLLGAYMARVFRFNIKVVCF